MLIIAWLFALQEGPNTYESLQNFLNSTFGLILLFAWSSAFFYHLLNGVRHLAWDWGYGFSLSAIYATGWAVIVLTGTAIVMLWLVIELTSIAG